MLYSSFARRLLENLTKTNASITGHRHTVSNRIVIALSGGLDSRVLLHLLARFKRQHPQYHYLAVHVHHGLSDNADHWLLQCQQWAHQADISFVAEKVTLSLGRRISIEQAARTARYQALAKHLDTSSVLLTGHHQSDQLETFLLALKRGSGPKGLSAMAMSAQFASARLLRPMLNVSRDEMQDYATSHQLAWIDDESNDDIRFDRNFIRHQITPALKQRWPSIEQTVARSAALCAQQESLLNELLYARYKPMIRKNGSISIPQLKEQSEAARGAIIRLWLQDQGFPMPSEKQLAQLWQDVALAQIDASPVFCYGNTQVGRHQQQLWVLAKQEDISTRILEWDIRNPLTLPDGLGCLELKPVCVPDNSFNAADFKASSIQTLSLPVNISGVIQVVFRATGIHVHPEGRTHGRELKKLLKDYAIPVWQRNRIPFLVDGDELIAAAGLCVGKKYSGTDYQLIWHKAE